MTDKKNIKFLMDNLINIFKFDAIQTPIIKERRNLDWVSFGDDNMFPNLLLDLYQTSAIHSTAINSKVDAVKGEGIKNIGDTIVNKDQETLNDIYEKITVDMVITGGFALNVIWNRAGDAIVEIYHLPVKNVRSGKRNEEDRIEEYFYSNHWNNTRKYPPIRYAAFSITDNKGENASQIYYPLNYSGANEYYNYPSYMGALNDIDLDARISRFHNSQIQNGLAPSLWVNFNNGEPEDADKRRLFDSINDSYAGENNAGRLILTFTDGSDTAPTINTLQATNDGLYTTLEERVQSRVLTAHRITSPLLVGIRATGAGLGSNSDEIEVAYTHFTSTAIQPIQRNINKNLYKITKLMIGDTPINIIPSKMDWNTTNDTLIQ